MLGLTKFNSVTNIKLAQHCQTSWDELESTSDRRVRRCSRCGELVFQVDAMAPDEALAFVGATVKDKRDLILYIRRDGTVKANDTRCNRPGGLVERFMKLSACFTL